MEPRDVGPAPQRADPAPAGGPVPRPGPPAAPRPQPGPADVARPQPGPADAARPQPGPPPPRGASAPVAAALEELAGVPARPLVEHPDAFARVHAGLQQALADIDNA